MGHWMHHPVWRKATNLFLKQIGWETPVRHVAESDNPFTWHYFKQGNTSPAATRAPPSSCITCWIYGRPGFYCDSDLAHFIYLLNCLPSLCAADKCLFHLIPKGALLDLNVRTVEAVLVQGTHCRVHVMFVCFATWTNNARLVQGGQSVPRKISPTPLHHHHCQPATWQDGSIVLPPHPDPTIRMLQQKSTLFNFKVGCVALSEVWWKVDAKFDGSQFSAWHLQIRTPCRHVIGRLCQKTVTCQTRN